MNIQTTLDADLIVRSFAYVAQQLAASALQEQIPGEAEKHRSALRLVRRDAFEMAEQGLRQKALTKTECEQLRATAAQTIAQGEQAIARIAAGYALHKLAA
ncbi:MAG TPA: hypothetical protein VJ652_00590 [Noviherbaspirillum sp.]|nr:hypothetical protein [Noviherbaspirillum sp.]